MSFSLWIDGTVAWAQGMYESRPMGTAVISATDLFRRRDFRPRRPAPNALDPAYVGLFASLGDLNAELRKRKRRARMKYTEPMRLVAGLVMLATVLLWPLPGQVPKEMDGAAICRLVTVDEASAILGAGAAQMRTKENCEYQAQVPGSNIPLRLVGGVFVHASAESAGKMYEMLKKAAEGKERNEVTLGPRAFSVEKSEESSLQFVATKGNKCLTITFSWPQGATPPAADKARPLVKKALSRLQ